MENIKQALKVFGFEIHSYSIGEIVLKSPEGDLENYRFANELELADWVVLCFLKAKERIDELANKLSKAEKNREQYRTELKEKRRVFVEERKARCVAESGKSPEEVQDAFNKAHAYAIVDSKQYMARFDEALVRLIGVKKFAV